MKTPAAITVMLFLGCLVLAGCHTLDGYKRSYTLAAVDRFGQRVEIGMTLEPKEALQVAEKLHAVAPGAILRPDAEHPLGPAAEALEILTAAGEVKSEKSKVKSVSGNEAFPVLGPAVYLTRDGALRLETHPEVIARYRAAGWVDAPVPAWDPVNEVAPQWNARRGRWVMREVGRD